MKLKNFLIESGYWLGMIVALFLTVRSCVELSHAQVRPPAPDNANQRLVYMRGDTLFQIGADGKEVPLLPPQDYQDRIDSLRAALYLYKPKPGRILVELDTLDNSMVYRPRIGSVFISALFKDSLWVTDKIFLKAHISEPHKTLKQFGWITDSIKWVATDTTFEGDCGCAHDWIQSEVYSTTFRSVLVCASGHHPKNSMRFVGSKYPSHEPEEHCPFEERMREKICSYCMRGVIEREKWFQHYVAPPKGEFERLK